MRNFLILVCFYVLLLSLLYLNGFGCFLQTLFFLSSQGTNNSQHELLKKAGSTEKKQTLGKSISIL